MGKKNVELWVGIFIFIGLFALAYMTIRLGSYDKFADSYDITISYRFTNGLVKGAPVRVAGVESGRVKDLILTPDAETKVDVVVSIESSVKLRRNVVAVINSLGIMGEKYIELLPQEAKDEILRPGERIIGEDPTSIAELTGEAKKFIQGVQEVFEDSESGNKLGIILDNLGEITGENNQNNIALTLSNLKDFSGRLKTFTGDLDVLAKEKKFSETVNNFHEASISLNDVLAQIKSGKGTIGELVYKSDVHDKLKEFLKDIMENPSKLFRPTKDKEKGPGSFLFFKKDE